MTGRFARPADHPPEASAAQPHPGDLAFAESDARRPFREPCSRTRTATGSPATSSPNWSAELKIEVDVVADMTVYNPFDFFVEESAEIWPFEYGEDLRPDLIIYRTPEPVGPRAQGISGPDRPVAETHRRFHRRSQRRPFARDQISHPDGDGRPDARGDAGARLGLVPQFELAPRPDPPQPRLRRPVRVRLSDPAQARSRRPRRAARHRPRLHRPARLGRGLSTRRRLDRTRPDLRAF